MRDAVLIAGFSVSLVGLWMIWPPLCYVAGGVLMVIFAVAWERYDAD